MSTAVATRRNAAAVFAEAFRPGREPRSVAYRAGTMDSLRTRLDGAERAVCLYPAGSAERDAYHAGYDEGRLLAQREVAA